MKVLKEKFSNYFGFNSKNSVPSRNSHFKWSFLVIVIIFLFLFGLHLMTSNVLGVIEERARDNNIRNRQSNLAEIHLVVMDIRIQGILADLSVWDYKTCEQFM